MIVSRIQKITHSELGPIYLYYDSNDRLILDAIETHRITINRAGRNYLLPVKDVQIGDEVKDTRSHR